MGAAATSWDLHPARLCLPLPLCHHWGLELGFCHETSAEQNWIFFSFFLNQAEFPLQKEKRKSRTSLLQCQGLAPQTPFPEASESRGRCLEPRCPGAGPAWPCPWTGDRGGRYQVPLLRMTCDGRSISPCPRYPPQPLSRTQPGPAAPCAARHPRVAHPPGPGVPETPSALGTADNPSAPRGTPLIIT